MGRFLIHLALSGVLVVAPTLRVLCYSSCVLEEGPMADTIAASGATPECHDRDRLDSTPESGSVPLQDDCTHGGDSSSSGLLTSAKLVGGDAPRMPVIATIALVHLAIVSSDIRRHSPSRPSGDQLLGRFPTPLRL